MNQRQRKDLHDVIRWRVVFVERIMLWNTLLLDAGRIYRTIMHVNSRTPTSLSVWVMALAILLGLGGICFGGDSADEDAARK